MVSVGRASLLSLCHQLWCPVSPCYLQGHPGVPQLTCWLPWGPQFTLCYPLGSYVTPVNLHYPDLPHIIPVVPSLHSVSLRITFCYTLRSESPGVT